MVGLVKRCMLKADKLTIFPVNSFPVIIKSLMESKTEPHPVDVVALGVSFIIALDDTVECCVLDPRLVPVVSDCLRADGKVVEVVAEDVLLT